MNKNITIVGVGYVGLSNSLLLAQHNRVIALDIDKDRVEKLNQRASPKVHDTETQEYITKPELNFVATLDKEKAYNFVIISTLTDYDPKTNYFNTSSVGSVIKDANSFNSNCTVIKKSTIPVGFTKNISDKLDVGNVIFLPEFLRKGKVFHDNLYPSRIIVGVQSERAKELVNLLVEGALKENVDILFTNSTEAEVIKLFSNTYLAESGIRDEVKTCDTSLIEVQSQKCQNYKFLILDIAKLPLLEQPKVDVFNIENLNSVDLIKFISAMENYMGKEAEKNFMPM